jgi:alpha-1,6-mannosyltransferase
VGIVAKLVLLGLIVSNVLVTTVLTAVSRANYPGGAALALVNSQPRATQSPSQSPTSVYIDNLAAQTGASLFTQEHAPPRFFLDSTNSSEWTYSKDPAPASYSAFTYVITEDAAGFPVEEWEAVGSVDAFERVDVRRGVDALVTKPALFVLCNKNAV